MARAFNSNIITETEDLVANGATVWLVTFSPTAGQDYHVCTGNEDITFSTVLYRHWPIALTWGSEGSDGNPMQFTVSVGDDKDGFLLEELRRHKGMRDAVVTVRLYFEAVTDAVVFATGEVVSSGYSIAGNTLNFTVGNLNVFSMKIPQAIFTPTCRHQYKNPNTCGYDGELASCDKTLIGTNGCIVHDNFLRFGGFLGIPEDETGTRTT